MTFHQFPAERLNERGQCPVCKRKPLVYKRDRKRFCTRCCRDFNIETGEQIQNWAYKKIAPDTFQRDCFDELELLEARGRYREASELRLSQLRGEANRSASG